MTGQTNSNLMVVDVGATSMATSLGLASSSGTTELVGTQINRVGSSTMLAVLNDGNGVRITDALADLRITTGASSTYDIDLEGVVTLGDVIDRINTTTGGVITASITVDGLGVLLSDIEGGGPTFSVTALNGSGAAEDLGILANDVDLDSQIQGRRLLAKFNSKLIRNLNGGSGIVMLGKISIQNRMGGPFTDVDLSSSESISDIIDLINRSGTGLTASLNGPGNGLLLTDTTGGTGDIHVVDLTGSAAIDLKLVGTHTNTNTVDSGSLQLQYITEATRLDRLGVDRGKFIITDSQGASATVDLTQGNEHTIRDVLEEINSRGLQLTAMINANGDGLLLRDDGPGSIKIRVEELGSSTAEDLGILGESAIAGADLNGSLEQTVHISSGKITTSTLLSALNGGAGVGLLQGLDEFSINTHDGNTHNIDLDGVTDIGDVIAVVEVGTGGSVSVEINPSLENNLLLTDNTVGASNFSVVAMNESTAAKDLGIEATVTNPTNVISGSIITNSTTLEDVAQRINDANIGITATIINDGSIGAPYRLILSSDQAGSAGAFIFNDGAAEFGVTNLTESQDAVVFLGGKDPASSLLVASATNQLQGTIPGTTIDLVATSSEPVHVTVSRDLNSVVGSIKQFVSDFNGVIDRIDELDSFNGETRERGLLLGDSAITGIRRQLFNAVINRNSDLAGSVTSLPHVGLTVTSGSTLSFNETKFHEAYEANPMSVESLFTFKQIAPDDPQKIVASGVGMRINQLLQRLTDPEFGPAEARSMGLQRQIEGNNRRIERLDELLAAKRLRLERQFIAMERVLAQMQSQSSALGALQSLTLLNAQNRNVGSSTMGY